MCVYVCVDNEPRQYSITAQAKQNNVYALIQPISLQFVILKEFHSLELPKNKTYAHQRQIKEGKNKDPQTTGIIVKYVTCFPRPESLGHIYQCEAC